MITIELTDTEGAIIVDALSSYVERAEQELISMSSNGSIYEKLLEQRSTKANPIIAKIEKELDK